MQKHAYIIHGYGASPQHHWFPWLKTQLEQIEVATEVIALPNSEQPDFDAWQETLKKHIGTPTAQDIFIAHSLGTISILHYLSQCRPPRIAGLVLVSAFDKRLPELPILNSYIDQATLDLSVIQQMSPQIYSIISNNDSIVNPKISHEQANTLQSNTITVTQGGHFLASDGFLQLPAAWEAMQQILSNT
ncbi:MAG: alpha/beta hydrolase [Cardiobacteriaceae bacterium]|nr:alpha/beta hydrolase [Cardiobacteriaceae bacterium]